MDRLGANFLETFVYDLSCAVFLVPLFACNVLCIVQVST